jgi:hypothetical protein
MSSEPKPFASLSSGLLARKGAARPAMRPQGFGQAGPAGLEDLGWDDMGFEPPKPAAAPRDDDHDAFGEEVVDHPRAHPTGLTPVHSPVHSQHAEIVERFNADDAGDEENDETAELHEAEAVEASEPEIEDSPTRAVVVAVSRAPAAARPRRAPRPRSAAGAKGKAAFTLRLDPGRHLKLRLACAVNGRSAQQLVTDALDQLLGNMPQLDAMAETAKRKD